MWDYYRYKPAPIDASKQLAKYQKENPDAQPIIASDRILVKSWWAKAWTKNLERYADYSNRIGRGRSYVRGRAVLDLSISACEVKAVVQGSQAKPYEISIKIDALPKSTWDKIVKRCSRRIGSLEELMAGKFPSELSELFTSREEGLFPMSKEIKFNCTCPDWAYMCKHVAAVLYGIGVRFDSDPALFFRLRNIDFTELIKKSIDEKMKKMLKNVECVTERVMKDVNTLELFGV